MSDRRCPLSERVLNLALSRELVALLNHDELVVAISAARLKLPPKGAYALLAHWI